LAVTDQPSPTELSVSWSEFSNPVADYHDEETLNQARRSSRADFCMGITFGHQVANDTKTGSGTTEKRGNQGFLGKLARRIDYHMISEA
jgi:hypothetical protein